MKTTLVALLVVIVVTALVGVNVLAKPDKVDGENVAAGRIPQEIVGSRYPRTYFPGTEKVGADEMRITALGTGMPNQSPSNVAACFLVELGNGDSFLFDIGTGSTDRLAGLEADYAKLDKVFISHLHTDHCGDLAALWVAGWLNGRYLPLQVYGPSGSTPELGTAVHVGHIRDAWAWDVTSRAGTLPNAEADVERLIDQRRAEIQVPLDKDLISIRSHLAFLGEEEGSEIGIETNEVTRIGCRECPTGLVWQQDVGPTRSE